MIRVQREDFDVGREYALLTGGKPTIGGVAMFVGSVRDYSGGEHVGVMTLEHYPGMTEKQLTRIEAEARERWDLDEVLIIHRHGRLEPGEQIVLVITAAAHRQPALDACAFLIDWLKTQAPFWKLEETNTGNRWVEAKSEDEAAAKRWE